MALPVAEIIAQHHDVEAPRRAIVRLLSVWDGLRRKPQMPQELLIQIEALREVVP